MSRKEFNSSKITASSGFIGFRRVLSLSRDSNICMIEIAGCAPPTSTVLLPGQKLGTPTAALRACKTATAKTNEKEKATARAAGVSF